MQKFFVFVEVIFLYIFSIFGLKETEAQSNKAISESILEIFLWNGNQNFRIKFFMHVKTVGLFSPFSFSAVIDWSLLYSQIIDSLLGE